MLCDIVQYLAIIKVLKQIDWALPKNKSLHFPIRLFKVFLTTYLRALNQDERNMKLGLPIQRISFMDPIYLLAKEHK